MLSGPQWNQICGYFLGLSFGVMQFVQALLLHELYFVGTRLGWNLKTGMTGLLFKKTLRLSPGVRVVCTDGVGKVHRSACRSSHRQLLK